MLPAFQVLPGSTKPRRENGTAEVMPLGTCSAPTPQCLENFIPCPYSPIPPLLSQLVTLPSLHAHFFHADVTVVQAIIHWKISFHPPQTSKLIPNYLTNLSVRSKCPQCLGVFGFGILIQALSRENTERSLCFNSSSKWCYCRNVLPETNICLQTWWD